MNPMNQICPVSDAEVAHLVRGDTLRGLADDIASGVAVPSDDAALAGGGVFGRRGVRPPRLRRRLLVGVPVAAALAIAGLIVTSLGGPGAHVGPVSVGPPKAQAAALEFTRHGRYIEVIVRNPVADPARYRAEFARYHLDIGLTLVPASPSLVGTLVAETLSANAGELKAITAQGRCFTGGGGDVCPVGVEVPINFRGSATLVFGRAATPGEQYETTADAAAPGEAMHGLRYEGKTVAAVLAMLASRGVTVATWRVARDCYSEARNTVPGNWLVYGALPWAPGQVVLWAAKTLPVPACAPVRVSASPSARPSGAAPAAPPPAPSAS